MVNINEIRNEWLESFEAQKIWYERIIDGSRSGKMSKAMRQTYNSNMRQLIMFWKAGGDESVNPDSILVWAKSVEPGEIMKMLKNFSLLLQGKEIEGYERRVEPPRGKYLNESSADGKAHGSIRGFFTHHQIWLPRMGKTNGGRARAPEGNLLETLSAPEPTPGTDFGNLVLVEGEIIVVGEYEGSSVGRFYIFQRGAADFKSSDLTINPSSVNVGGTVTISVECSNEGSMSGSHTVTLKVDGEVEDEKTVTVAPSEFTTISFDAPTSEKGTYSVEIEGLTGSYEVKGGIPGFPVESLIVGLAVAILVLWFRQRTS